MNGIIEIYYSFISRTVGYENYVLMGIILIMFVFVSTFTRKVLRNSVEEFIYIGMNEMNRAIDEERKKLKRRTTKRVRNENPKYVERRREKNRIKRIKSKKKTEEVVKKGGTLCDMAYGIIIITFSCVYIGGFALCVLDRFNVNSDFYYILKYIISTLIILVSNSIATKLINKKYRKRDIKELFKIYDHDSEDSTLIADLALISAGVSFLPLNKMYAIILLFMLIGKYNSFSLSIEDDTIKSPFKRFKIYLRKVFKNKSILIKLSRFYFFGSFLSVILSIVKYLYQRPYLYLTHYLIKKHIFIENGVAHTYILLTGSVLIFISILYLVKYSYEEMNK